ncbi:MAG: hypothetical protein P3W97_006185 [Tepidimonas sp.]|uniref:hypothetical protein n=1 Tax=Tepidimonas sp. TaxID=2002775 RepID=UPI00259EDE43|nr:hypothetical protein [Tepidimonas sp.]MDM7456836.1 hypothetical protein [Tepidimonas sp.]
MSRPILFERRRWLGAAAGSLMGLGAGPALLGCGASRPPRLALVAGLTGSASDIGVAVRNGALLAQASAHHPKRPALIAAEWAATDQLILGGGRAIEGAMVTQFFDHDSKAPAYQVSAQSFQARFGRTPGFAETAAYDAARVVLQAPMEQHRQELLKDTRLRLRRFEGVQNTIVFDDTGDCDRLLYVTQVRRQRFITLRI